MNIYIYLFSDRSLSDLIEHCLGVPEKTTEPATPLPLPPLHAECAQYVPHLQHIKNLVLDGCDPNQIVPGGRTPLHTLLCSDHAPAVSLTPLVSALLDAGARLDLSDGAGDTALSCVQRLLSADRMAEAAEVAELFLTGDRPCDVNNINAAERSLLSHSVTHLDRAEELTRILVNHGGRVWPRPAPSGPVSVPELTRDREQSAFTWFLRSAMTSSSLAGAENTLTCLSHEMGRDPGRMKSHVLRVMLVEGKHPRVLGPLYLQLKTTMAPFWSEPQQLRYLAWNSIRKSIGPKRLAKGSRQLGLPSPLRRYLTLSSAKSSRD